MAVLDLPKWRGEGDLVSLQVYDSGPYAADGSVREGRVSFDRDAYLKMAYVWTGISYGGRADSHCDVYRSDGSLIARLQCDCYAEPSYPRTQLYQFSPGMRLRKGEEVIVRHMSKGFAPNTQAHHQVILWVL